MKKNDQVKLLMRLHKLESNGDGVDGSQAFQRLKKNLDPSILRRYQRVKERKGTGLAVLRDGTCSGCKMIYPETHDILRYKNFVYNCEYCGRLLLVTEKSA